MPLTTETEPALPTNRYRYYVLVMLTLVYAVNFIDRQIIGILSPFIKADLGLDDAQLGYLKGIYFALLYTVTGIPIAWLADRSNRINIITVSLTLWSGFTALSGLAGNYLQLVLCRIGVGIGEAGGTPPAHSIIADLFAPGQRATAMAIYALGIPFGIMLAYLASAFVLSGGQADWRTVMIAVGVPGILLALLLRFSVREPLRQQHQTHQQMPVLTSIKRLLKTPAWWGMVLGITLSSFANYAVIAWQMDFFVRRFATLDVVWLLVVFGVINGTLYALGVWSGGAIADRWARTQQGAYAALPALALCLGVPAFLLAIHSSELWVAISGFTVLLVTSGTYFGPCFAMTQTLSPANCRAMSTALFFFILNLIALGGGPTFVGVVSEWYTPEYGELNGLIKALEWLVVPFLLSIAVFAWTARRLPQDLAAASEQ